MSLGIGLKKVELVNMVRAKLSLLCSQLDGYMPVLKVRNSQHQEAVKDVMSMMACK